MSYDPKNINFLQNFQKNENTDDMPFIKIEAGTKVFEELGSHKIHEITKEEMQAFTSHLPQNGSPVLAYNSGTYSLVSLNQNAEPELHIFVDENIAYLMQKKYHVKMSNGIVPMDAIRQEIFHGKSIQTLKDYAVANPEKFIHAKSSIYNDPRAGHYRNR